MAFNRHDGRTSEDTIDSTVAGLCLALDRCSPWGEGYIIANHNTVERLILERRRTPRRARRPHLVSRHRQSQHL